MRRIIKRIIKTYILLHSVLLMAAADHTPINHSNELRDWCRIQSGQHFKDKNITPYNWSYSSWREANVLQIKGQWRVNGKSQIVYCRSLVGGARKYAVITMPNQTLSPARYNKETPINSQAELRDWCKYSSAKFLLMKNIIPFNWTFSQHIKENFLRVDGEWRAKGTTYLVKCDVRKGVAEKYADLQITKK